MNKLNSQLKKLKKKGKSKEIKEENKIKDRNQETEEKNNLIINQNPTLEKT